MGSAVQLLRSCVSLGILAALTVYLPPNTAAPGRPSASQATTQNVDALVRDVVHNEIAAQLGDTSLWCYREERQEDGKPNKTLEVCQTKDGELDRLVAVSGRELDTAQRRSEDERIPKLIGHPEQLRAK